MSGTDPSIGGGRGPRLPPGFRFHPTDEELVVHYLKRKAQSAPLPVSIIAEIDLYKFDPWELPAKAVFGEQEWYFFSPRDRKYPNGARPNRAATSGYWKATGTDKPVLTSGGTQKVGVKKALVFYGGKPPKGTKTDWIMHEYRLITGNKAPAYDPTPNKRASLRLDEWVLCRIYKKNTKEHHQDDGGVASVLGLRRNVGRSSVAASTYAPPSVQMITDHRNAHHLFDEMPATEPRRPAMMPTFLHEQGVASGSNSMAGLLNQLQPTVPLGESTVFRQPYQISGFTWYS